MSATPTERLRTAPVGRLLAGMSAQTTASVMLYGLYTLANTFFVARGVGPFAAGGVAVVAPVLLILGAVSTTVGTGGASVVSRALGAGDRERAARAAAHAFVLFWGAALAVGGLGLVFLDPLLHALGAGAELMPYARPYATILLAGAVTATGFSAIIRAEGNTRYSLYIWLIPVTTNLVLDVVLILVLRWGVVGAAVATLTAQTISAGMGVYYFFVRRRDAYRIAARHFRPHAATVGQIVAIGSPSLVSQGSLSVLLALVNQLLSGLGGAVAVTAFGIVARLMTFFVMPQTGIVQGAQPIIGFNHAAGDDRRVCRALGLALAGSAGYGLAAAALGVGGGRWLIGLFLDPGPTASLGVSALAVIGLSFPFKGTATVTAAYFQSIGRVRMSFAIPLIGTVGVHLPVLLVGAHLFSETGIWFSFLVCDLVMTAVCLAILRPALRRPAGSHLRPDRPAADPARPAVRDARSDRPAIDPEQEAHP